MPEKNLLDYFIKRTDERFDELSEKIDRLGRFAWVIVLLCMAISPVGERVMNMFPKVLEMAEAVARGK